MRTITVGNTLLNENGQKALRTLCETFFEAGLQSAPEDRADIDKVKFEDFYLADEAEEIFYRYADGEEPSDIFNDRQRIAT